MKTLFKKLLPALLLLGLLGARAEAQTKIATVDLGRVFTNYWKTKQADAALQDRKAEMAKSDKDLIDAWQKSKDDYTKLLADANNQAVSSEERDRRKKAAEEKLKEIKDAEENIGQFERQARATLGEQSMRMRDNILTEIRAAVNAKAKAGGFTLVLDTAAQSSDRTPVVLFSTLDNDLTEPVLGQLNAGAPMDIPGLDNKKPETGKDSIKVDPKKKP